MLLVRNKYEGCQSGSHSTLTVLTVIGGECSSVIVHWRRFEGDTIQTPWPCLFAGLVSQILPTKCENSFTGATHQIWLQFYRCCSPNMRTVSQVLPTKCENSFTGTAHQIWEQFHRCCSTNVRTVSQVLPTKCENSFSGFLFLSDLFSLYAYSINLERVVEFKYMPNAKYGFVPISNTGQWSLPPNCHEFSHCIIFLVIIHFTTIFHFDFILQKIY